MREFQPIDLALMFSKAHKKTSDRLLELETQLEGGGQHEAANSISLIRGEHAAMANAFLDIWKEAQE